MEEIGPAVKKGAGKKAPGRDGICIEFFKLNWDTIKICWPCSTTCIGMVKFWNKSMGQ
jgi:hypothetical protein